MVGIWLHNSGQLEKLATNTPTASTSTKLALMLGEPFLLLILDVHFRNSSYSVNYNSQYYIEPVGQAGREQAKLPSTSALGFFPHHEVLYLHLLLVSRCCYSVCNTLSLSAAPQPSAIL